MNKIISLTALVLLAPVIGSCQDTAGIISQVKMKQQSISSLSYTISRTDTIGTYVRNMSGTATLERNPQDTIFGFKFWSRKESEPIQKMFDGHVGYAIDVSKKSYEITTSATGIRNLLNGGGGHLVLPELIKLEAGGAARITLLQDELTYTLLFKYADLVKYDISNKFKAVRINKATMMPVSVREHQESLGRIQDLYYEIRELTINPVGTGYDFSNPGFLKTYQHVVPVRKPSPVFTLLNTTVPSFKLQGFTNGGVSTADFKGHVVLLDFWEVWCGPCLESMPRVQALAQKYRDRGLLAYGIVNDTTNITSAKLLAKKNGFILPMLIGGEQLRNAYKITGVPLYILVDKAGKVAFISEGYSEMIEEAIKKALDE